MAAITGAAGLAPTLAAISRGGYVALANKEALVCAGDVMLRAVQAADPSLALGALWSFATQPAPALADAADAGFRAVHPFVSSVDPDLVHRAHAAGLALNVWTVNAPDDLRAMVAWGVDAVITDRLDDALAVARGDGV